MMNDWELFREAVADENGRWERLHGVARKLRMALENPGMRGPGEAGLLDQLEARLLEASRLFPAPDWLDQDLDDPAKAERWFANHVGELLDAMARAVELLRDEAGREDGEDRS